jgi:hypothetical protein
MTDRLISVLAGMLRHPARLLPPRRRQQSEALRAEAAALPGGGHG